MSTSTRTRITLQNLMFSNETVRSMGAPDQKLNVYRPEGELQALC